MDLLKELKEDEIYNIILDKLSEEERKGVEAYMEDYMGQWQKQLFDPLEEQLKDPEYREELNRVLKQQYDTFLRDVENSDK